MERVGGAYDNVDSQHAFVTKRLCRIKEGRAMSKHRHDQKMRVKLVVQVKTKCYSHLMS